MERLLVNKAIRHWKEWLPNRYAELLEANQLITAAEAAAKGAALEMKELMDAGMRRDEAEEIVLPKWILLPPEPEAEQEAEPETTTEETPDEKLEAWAKIKAKREKADMFKMG